MPRFFFEISDTGDVYHDSHGIMLHGAEATKERAFEMVRKLPAGPPPTGYRDLACTVRDITGNRLMEVRIEFGTPQEVEKPQR
jgi:hypothetical protein